YASARADEPIRLPGKTTSFRAWAMALRELGASDRLAAEAAYWKDICAAETARLPGEDRASRLGDTSEVAFELEPALTTALLGAAHAAYGTEVNDLLLAALAVALRRWMGGERVRVAVEGHGREDLGFNVDPSR